MKYIASRVVRFALVGISWGVWASAGRAEVSVPAIFGDHMVLQANQTIPVWGRAAPGEKIVVQLGTCRETTTATPEGQWRVNLPAHPVAEGLTLTIRGDTELQFKDVLVGEVWVGSGQSNMQWPVSQSLISSGDLARANNPRIRFFTVDRTTSLTPLQDVKGAWQTCDTGTVLKFSAVAYFFGRKLEKDLGRPVGLINASWGGTRIEPWTPFAALGKIPDFGSALQALAEQRRDIGKKLDDYQQKIQKARALRAEALALEADESLGAEYRRAGFDDSRWSPIEVNGVQWEKTVLPNFDGVVWYRRTVDLPAEWAGRDLILNLGPVDEMDVTWFNETRVGGTGLMRKEEVQYWDHPRVYKVPGSAVKSGLNTLVVRVIDTGYAGGIWGASPDAMKLTLASEAGGGGVSLAGTWKYQVAVQFIPEPKAPVNTATPTALYNAMIHPLVPYAIRGVIWYQGEANVAEGPAYLPKMQALIEGWREAWGQGDFPFYYVQLAPYTYGTNSHFLPVFWDVQRRAMGITNTGMAVTTDLGNLRDIHPRRKVQVGERLALWALAKTYVDSRLTYSGPLARSAAREGAQVRVCFAHAEGGLHGLEGESLSWFDLAGTDGLFVRANARIEGETVRVWSDSVAKPIRVRYGFAVEAAPELTNAQGLPASPFDEEVVE